MGILDKLLGGGDPAPKDERHTGTGAAAAEDEQAIARYRYMLQTAPPETIEQAHAEAFEKLTPEQRNLLLQRLSADVPDAERSAVGAKNDPQTLARLATRAEVRSPGTMERTLGGMRGGGIGMGGMMAGSFLSTVAGVVIGSAIAQSFFGDSGSADDAGGMAESDADADSDMGDMGGGDFGDI